MALAKALHEAVINRDEQTALLLLRHKADPNGHRWSEVVPNLWIAAKYSTSAAMAILNHPPPGFDVNKGSEISRTTPLFKAADRGDGDLVRALLERGADMEIRDSTGATALWAASNMGRLNCVRILLEAGADTEVRAELPFGYATPLEIAENNGFVEVATLISLHIEARNEKGRRRKRPHGPAEHPRRVCGPPLPAGRVSE